MLGLWKVISKEDSMSEDAFHSTLGAHLGLTVLPETL